MKVSWKAWLFLYGALVQIVFLGVITRWVFSARAARLSDSLPTNLCAAVLGGVILTWLIGRLFRVLYQGKDSSISAFLACAGASGVVAITVTYELVVFALSLSITLNPVRNEGAAFSFGMFLLTLLSMHVYTFLDFIPTTVLGFLSGIIAGWIVLKASRAKPTTRGTPLSLTSF